MQIMCNHDSLWIRFGSLERDCSPSNFNLTGFVYDSLFFKFLLFLYLSSMIHFFDSPFLLCHSKSVSHDNDFQFHLPLCAYCLPIFYGSYLRMSIGCLQPLIVIVTIIIVHVASIIWAETSFALFRSALTCPRGSGTTRETNEHSEG